MFLFSNQFTELHGIVDVAKNRIRRFEFLSNRIKPVTRERFEYHVPGNP